VGVARPRGGSAAERFMRECAGVGAQRATPATTGPTPVVGIGNAAFERGSVGVDVLTRDRQAQGIEIAKRRQIWRGKGSVEQVEVFLMVSVTTSILGDLDPHPRPLTSCSAHPHLRRAILPVAVDARFTAGG